MSKTPPDQMVQPVVTCPPAPSPITRAPKGALDVLPNESTQLEPEIDAGGDAMGQQNEETETPDTIVVPPQPTELDNTTAVAGPDLQNPRHNSFPFTATPVLPENPHPTQVGPSSWIKIERSLVSDTKASTIQGITVQKPLSESSCQPVSIVNDDDPVGEALSNLYIQNEEPPWDMMRKDMLAKAEAVAAAIAEEKANAAKTMPPPPPPGQGLEPVENGLDPKTIKDMIINDKLKDMHSKATILTEKQQRLGPYLGELSMKGVKFFDGFNNTWFLPREDIGRPTLPVTGSSRGYEASDDQLQMILERGGDSIARAYRWIEKETEEQCAHEWTRCGAYRSNRGMYAPTHAPLLPRSWAEAKANLTMNDMVGMICRYRLLLGKVCFPGYITVNVVIGLQGRLVATPHYVPSNVDLLSLVSKLNSWDPPTASRVGVLFQTIRLKLTELKQCGPDYNYAQRKAAELEEELRQPRFELDVPGSQRRRWSYKAWDGDKFLMPVGKVPSDEGWTMMEGPGDVERIRDIAAQGQLVVLIRPWELRVRSMLEKINGLMQDARYGRKEPQFTSEQLKIVDALLGQGPADTREQAKVLGRILKEQREM